MNWGRIEGAEWAAARVIIAGQGPSWRWVHPKSVLDAKRRGATVVAVNGAISQLPFADFFFTLDFSNANVRRLTNPLPRVHYVAAAPPAFRDRLPDGDYLTWLRRVSRERDGHDPRPFPERVAMEVGHGLAEDPSEIYTGNSAFGALGLAYHMRPSRVVLLGIDGRGHRRWDGSPNDYVGHLPELFEGALPDLERRGIEVVNGSPGSAVSCFPIGHPELCLEWLTE